MNIKQLNEELDKVLNEKSQDTIIEEWLKECGFYEKFSHMSDIYCDWEKKYSLKYKDYEGDITVFIGVKTLEDDSVTNDDKAFRISYFGYSGFEYPVDTDWRGIGEWRLVENDISKTFEQNILFEHSMTLGEHSLYLDNFEEKKETYEKEFKDLFNIKLYETFEATFKKYVENIEKENTEKENKGKTEREARKQRRLQKQGLSSN